MIAWTYQRKEFLKELNSNGILVHEFLSDCRPAYAYILAEYNRLTDSAYQGLLFLHCGSTQIPVLDTFDDLDCVLSGAGFPSGTTFSSATHVLLKLDIPEDIFILHTDFYRFADLLWYTEEEPNGISLAQEHLYEPNGLKGTFELIQGNVPYIKKEWIKEVYTNYKHSDYLTCEFSVE